MCGSIMDSFPLKLKDLIPGKWYRASTWSDNLWAKLSSISGDKDKFYYNQRYCEEEHIFKFDWYRVYPHSSFVEGYYDPVFGMSTEPPYSDNFPSEWFVAVTVNALDQPELLSWRIAKGLQIWKNAGFIDQEGIHSICTFKQGVLISYESFLKRPQLKKLVSVLEGTYDTLDSIPFKSDTEPACEIEINRRIKPVRRIIAENIINLKPNK